ncbi:hypothetical protein EYZ11_001864 [Aspergillus tanneri]|uniref:CFEM domain-containing protein n=1 Tax=Aspergillus tanneri TaxID=1220188 RepID=A0A4S3JU88_9EURO|nr:hypothetical protein EYZ11_001864 [Aspergillus tanneri]
MKLPLVFIAVLTAGLSNAQLGNIPRCSVNCFVNALSKDGCSELTDFSCHCQKTGLVETVTPCVRDACDQSDQVVFPSWPPHLCPTCDYRAQADVWPYLDSWIYNFRGYGSSYSLLVESWLFFACPFFFSSFILGQSLAN